MQEYKRYICVICGFIYDEAEGWPEDGIEPGTRWEDVPENWFCPDCGAGKKISKWLKWIKMVLQPPTKQCLPAAM